MKQTKNFQRIQNAIDQSLIHCMLINPLLYPTLSHELTRPIPGFTLKSYIPCNDYDSLLKQMNPVLLEDITEEEKEINSIIQEDNCEQLKMKFINHLLNPNQKDRNEISLIERCVFFNSKQCLNYLLEENVSIDRHTIEINFKDYEIGDYEIGLMEYGALKGNREIVNICLEKGQEIQEITIILGLIGHRNELVEWMIEEGKRRGFFDETIKTRIFGLVDNIEFNEILLKSGININAKDDYKRRRYKEIQH